MKKEELYVTAALAKLELDDSEAEVLSGEVTRILDYFAKMSEINVDELTPTTHALLDENRLRPDLETAGDRPDPDTLLESAPDIDDRFIIIPNVL